MRLRPFPDNQRIQRQAALGAGPERIHLDALDGVAMGGGEPVEAGENPLYRVILALVVYGFFVGFWARSGRTLGMQSWRLQLQTLEGGKPTLGAVTIRFFAALISWPPLALGFLWQLWDKDKLTWDDRISKTKLVYYPKEEQ